MLPPQGPQGPSSPPGPPAASAPAPAAPQGQPAPQGQDPQRGPGIPKITPEEMAALAEVFTPQNLPAILKMFSAVLVDGARAIHMAQQQQQQQGAKPAANPAAPAPKPAAPSGGIMGPPPAGPA
jgi:hypothetical protein